MTWETASNPVLCSQLCITLLHSVWLVALMAALAWIADRLVGRRAVQRSYAIHVVALLASILALPATYWMVTTSEVAPAAGRCVVENVIGPPPAIPEVVPSAAFSDSVADVLEFAEAPLASSDEIATSLSPATANFESIWTIVAPWITALYVSGVVLMLAKLALGMWRAQRLRAAAIVLQDGPLVDLLRSLADRWSMRVVPMLAQAEQTITPKVIGLLRPTILLPASAIGGLSLEELELILAHELAHIRRYDMWVNLLQRLAETVLFFNPALWYLSRRISLLREYCCDEAVCGGTIAPTQESQLRYAQALLRVVEVSGANQNVELASLAASGRSPSELRRRVARLFGEPLTESVRFSRGGLLAAALAILLIAGPVVWQSVAETDVATETTAEVDENEAEDQTQSASVAAASEPAKPEESARDTAPITVFGRALDQNGKPIAGAEIFLASPRTDGKPLAIVKSDDDGSYRFEEVPLPIKRADTNDGKDTGSIEVFGRAEGLAFSWRPLKWFHPDSTHVDGMVPDPTWDLPYKYGREDPIELDLTFGPPKSIRGRVVNDLGEPIAGAKLAIRSTKLWGDSRSLRELESFNWKSLVPESIKLRHADDEGRFEFTNLPEDRLFWIDVEPPGYTERNIYAVTRDGVDKDSKGNRVYSGDFEIVFERPRKVKLRVVYGDTGKPADRVGVGGKVNVAGFFETTDANGIVEVPLADGRYEVIASPRYKTPYLWTNAEVTVSDETAKEPITIRLKPAAVVDITVVDVDSHVPLEGADVWWTAPTESLIHVGGFAPGQYQWEVETRISHFVRPRSDADGKMRVLLAPGQHRIAVGKKSYPDGYTPVEPNGKVIDCQLGKPVVVVFHMKRENASDAPPSVSSEPSAPAKQFTLDIVDPDGKPVPGASVEIRTSPIPEANQILEGEFVRKSNYGSFAKTDSNGRLVVTFPHKPARLNFSIKTPGYGPYWAAGTTMAIARQFQTRSQPNWSLPGPSVESSSTKKGNHWKAGRSILVLDIGNAPATHPTWELELRSEPTQMVCGVSNAFPPA